MKFGSSTAVPKAPSDLSRTVKNIFVQVFYFSLIGLCLTVFVSISAMTLFVALLKLSSLFLVDWRDLWTRSKLILLLPFLYPLAVLVNLFSAEPLLAAQNVLVLWSWPLMAFPIYFLMQQYERHPEITIRKIKNAAIAFMIGLGIAVIYSLHGFFYEGVFSKTFWDTGRWRTFVGVGFVSVLILTLRSIEKRKVLILSLALVALLLVGLAVFLSMGRTTYLAIAVASILIFVLSRKRLRVCLTLFGFVLAAFAASSLGSWLMKSPEKDFMAGFRSRLLSIGQTKLQHDGSLASSDASAQARLSMWEVGIDLVSSNPARVGGFGRISQSLEFHFSKMGQDYRQEHRVSEFAENDLHSSYLNSVVENGILFALLFWGLAYMAFFRGAWLSWKTQRSLDLLAVSVMAYYFVSFVFGHMYASFEMVFFVPAWAYLLWRVNEVRTKVLPQRLKVISS